MKVISDYLMSSVMTELRYKLEKSIEIRRTYYETRSLGELATLFSRAIKRRGWTFDYVGPKDIIYKSRHGNVKIVDPFSMDWRRNIPNDSIKRFISRYLALLDKKYEEAAENLLESLDIRHFTTQEAYDLYVRLAQVSVSKISK